jgi:uracil-DNA glycosylase
MAWAMQGVFLLNTTLTVQQAKPLSHAGQGWEQFTGAVIEAINQHASNVVFMLWGKPSQEKGKRIDESKHLVLRSSHPSPLSAHTGWFGQHQFSKANEYLQSHGKTPVNWSL